MHADQLVLCCYAEKKGDQWQAFCIDLCLAVQGDSLEDVRQKLESMIVEYVEDALAGEDKPYAAQLLTRRAPLRYQIKYRLLAAIGVSQRANGSG